MLQGELIQCPYCGETIEVLIDESAGEQQYVEDCSVCCRPIEIAVTSTGDSWAVRNLLAMREMMRRHPEGPQGARRIGTKDLSLAVRLGRELGLEVPIAEFFAGRPWT